MAGAAFCICAAFSSSVIRDTRSAARASKLRCASWYTGAGTTPSAAYDGNAVNVRIAMNTQRVIATKLRLLLHSVLPSGSCTIRACGPSTAPTNPPATSVLSTVPSSPCFSHCQPMPASKPKE